MLRLYLFGAPRLEVNGKAMAMRRSKALALLAYLGVTKQPHERDTLLGLLWPEFDAASARNNLRRELSILRSTLGDQVLITQGQQIAWNPQPAFWLDVAEFQAQLAASRSLQPNSEPWAAALTAAVALAGEEFLAGFSLPESSGFDDWQFFQREELRQHLSEALEALSGWHQERAEYSSGSAFARRWLALDPLHEPARRMLMELYARSGQTTAALRCYEEGVALLEAELGAAPDDATTALNTAIKARRLAPAPPESPLSSAAAPARSSLDEAPLPLTSFIGRHAELQDLIAQLCDPNCRLLSVVGPGGIGKTRLALEVTARLGTSCTAGAVFVALQGASSPIHIPGAIARALDLTLSGDGDPWNRLAHLLRERELMLVLDNFEHVSDGAPWLAALLHAAPKLKLLVTSREALKLQEEWLYPLGGLGLPDAESDFEAGNTDAVQLFVARARQNRRNFSPADDYDQIARICHMVGGMPLAIELAAAWIATLSCAEIAAAIAHNLTFLETSMRNLPARHRSVMVVFDQTWAQLDRDVQRVLMRLSMLPGGFTSEAAAAIAGATPALLARLLDQALLRRDSGGRYRFHELIRQYAARHLQNSGEFASEVWESCGRYYGQFLAGLHELYERGEDRRAIVMLEVERDNFRSAWPAILAQTADEPLRELLQGVQAFYLVRGPYQEGLDLLGVAETKLRAAGAEFAAQRVLAHVLTNIGFIHIRVARSAKQPPALKRAARFSRHWACRLRRETAPIHRLGRGLLRLFRAITMPPIAMPSSCAYAAKPTG
ncbi:MAG: AAA family ATPase [Oscillochloris sp.]|nr:AAA family ATPase [Oscillochloris sp.]